MLLITSTEQPRAFALWFMSFNSSGGVGRVDWEGHAAERMTGWKYNIRPLSSFFFFLPRIDKPRLSKLRRQWGVHTELCTFNVSEWQSTHTPPHTLFHWFYAWACRVTTKTTWIWQSLHEERRSIDYWREALRRRRGGCSSKRRGSAYF